MKVRFLIISVVAALVIVFIALTAGKINYRIVNKASLLRQVALAITAYRELSSDVKIEDAVRLANPELEGRLKEARIGIGEIVYYKTSTKAGEVLIRWKNIAVYCDGHVGNIVGD